MSAELTKISELIAAATKETFAPFKGRVQAWVDVVQSAAPPKSSRRNDIAKGSGAHVPGPFALLQAA